MTIGGPLRANGNPHPVYFLAGVCVPSSCESTKLNSSMQYNGTIPIILCAGALALDSGGEMGACDISKC